jgi:hypothetical protein
VSIPRSLPEIHEVDLHEALEGAGRWAMPDYQYITFSFQDPADGTEAFVRARVDEIRAELESR